MSKMEKQIKERKQLDEKTLMDIYLLTCKYIYNNPIIHNMVGDDMEDCVMNAYIMLCDIVAMSYDPSKGAISTYVYSCLKSRIMPVIYQTKYNIDDKLALRAYRASKSNSDYFAVFNSLYHPKSLSVSGAAIDKDDTIEDSNELPISELADETLDPAYIYEEGQLSSDEDIEELLNDLIDKYLSTHNYNNNRNVDMWRDIIISLTLRDNSVEDKITLESVGNKWGITRERVRQIYNKFKKWVITTKQIELS